ncbi:MAG: glutaredoxin family protein [Spongiibacteraceae bacterium]|jgi:glutaredoxin|nr:glutaredoxin family protein [Spongiibacteraceae bacterium]
MSRQAALYRMVTDEHICPYGIKSRDLLKRRGFEVEDHRLQNAAETDAFKAKHGVDTTPQTFIDGARIGGYDDLLAYFGEQTLKQEGTTYQPVIAVFATTLLLALAVSWAMAGAIVPALTLRMFIAFSMCVLAILKLRDLYGFSNQFITYDLLAMRWVRYAYIYPFVEMLAGVCMVAGVMVMVAAPAALFIGTVGAISVIKAVYIDRRELKCACVGGDSSVPLGFISLTENLMMVAMAIWMMYLQI